MVTKRLEIISFVNTKILNLEIFKKIVKGQFSPGRVITQIIIRPGYYYNKWLYFSQPSIKKSPFYTAFKLHVTFLRIQTKQ